MKSGRIANAGSKGIRESRKQIKEQAARSLLRYERMLGENDGRSERKERGGEVVLECENGEVGALMVDLFLVVAASLERFGRK